VAGVFFIFMRHIVFVVTVKKWLKIGVTHLWKLSPN